MRKMFFAILILGMIVSAASICCFAEGNLLKNASFEQAGADMPDGWEKWMYVPDGSTIKVENGQGHDGSKFIIIDNKKDNDARVKQAVTVKENSIYKLSCWAKTEKVEERNTGANMSVFDYTHSTKDLKGSNNEWQLLEMYVKIGAGVSSIDVCVGLGGYGNMNIGKAYFDDLKVEEVSKAPEGILLADISKKTSDGNGSSGASGEKKSGSLVIVLLVVAAALIGGAVYFIFARKQRNADNGEESEKDGYEEGEYEEDEEVEEDDDSYTDEDK